MIFSPSFLWQVAAIAAGLRPARIGGSRRSVAARSRRRERCEADVTPRSARALGLGTGKLPKRFPRNRQNGIDKPYLSDEYNIQMPT
jgi:hypothetical protein